MRSGAKHLRSESTSPLLHLPRELLVNIVGRSHETALHECCKRLRDAFDSTSLVDQAIAVYESRACRRVRETFPYSIHEELQSLRVHTDDTLHRVPGYTNPNGASIAKRFIRLALLGEELSLGLGLSGAFLLRLFPDDAKVLAQVMGPHVMDSIPASFSLAEDKDYQIALDWANFCRSINPDPDMTFCVIKHILSFLDDESEDPTKDIQHLVHHIRTWPFRDVSC